VHVTNDIKNLEEPESCSVPVRVGSGQETIATTKGRVTLKLGKSVRYTLHDVLCVPGFVKNIVSLTKICAKGNKIEFMGKDTYLHFNGTKHLLDKHSNDRMWYLQQDTRTIAVQRSLPTELPNLIEAEGQGKDEKTTWITVSNQKESKSRGNKKTLNINDAHEMLGHPCKRTTRLTFKGWGYELTGEMKACIGCLIHKNKAKRIPHQTRRPAMRPSQTLHVDTTGPFDSSLGGARYDTNIICAFSKQNVIAHLKTKDQVSKSVELHLDYLNGLGHKVEALRCDNAGEHVELKNICDKKGIRLEYTSPNTPQQNGVIEKRIADDQQSCMAMLTCALHYATCRPRRTYGVV
jgi:hypothetical protein